MRALLLTLLLCGCATVGAVKEKATPCEIATATVADAVATYNLSVLLNKGVAVAAGILAAAEEAQAFICAPPALPRG